jgi:hypothetical protein
MVKHEWRRWELSHAENGKDAINRVPSPRWYEPHCAGGWHLCTFHFQIFFQRATQRRKSIDATADSPKRQTSESCIAARRRLSSIKPPFTTLSAVSFCRRFSGKMTDICTSLLPDHETAEYLDIHALHGVHAAKTQIPPRLSTPLGFDGVSRTLRADG